MVQRQDKDPGTKIESLANALDKHFDKVSAVVLELTNHYIRSDSFSNNIRVVVEAVETLGDEKFTTAVECALEERVSSLTGWYVQQWTRPAIRTSETLSDNDKWYITNGYGTAAMCCLALAYINKGIPNDAKAKANAEKAVDNAVKGLSYAGNFNVFPLIQENVAEVIEAAAQVKAENLSELLSKVSAMARDERYLSSGDKLVQAMKKYGGINLNTQS